MDLDQAVKLAQETWDDPGSGPIARIHAADVLWLVSQIRAYPVRLENSLARLRELTSHKEAA